MWVIVEFKYERHGDQAARKILLANSSRSRGLGRVSAATLAIEPASSSPIVIADLFVREGQMPQSGHR